MTDLTDVIRRAARIHKDKLAFTDPAEAYTYGETGELGERVAAAIGSLGLSRKPIAIFMERSARVPAAMAGVLLSGNFYAVMDTESPAARLGSIADTLETPLVLCDGKSADRCRALFPGIKILTFGEAVKTKRPTVKANGILPTDPAFVIFTSGSTGTPKGTVLSHGNVLAYIRWFTGCFGISAQTSFGAQTPFYFSMSVSDLYGAWTTGAAYHVVPQSYFAFPGRLIGYLNERRVDTIYWVPTAYGIAAKFDLFGYERPNGLKNALFAGEVMPVKYLNYWRRYLPETRFANLFGPTETTDICAYYIVDRPFGEGETLPIGGACAGARLLVADEAGKPVGEPGVTGELYVAGDFVAKGYYRNPEKTAAAFVQNPFHDDYPEIVYRTGDLVSWNDRGELTYRGRRDFQIKRMGYRIEPGEIEAVMNGAEEIELCVCLYDADTDELILFYEGQAARTAVAEQARKRLVSYMVPSKFVRVDAFPYNANGKLDKKKLKSDYISDKNE